MIEYWNGRVARKHEVAVHAVREENSIAIRS